jgi:hypothetical protein
VIKVSINYLLEVKYLRQSRRLENREPLKAGLFIYHPPKYSVSEVVGFIKGKRAISIVRTYMGRGKNFTGQSFWARG